MSWYSISSLVASIVTLFLAGFVFWKGKRNPINITFSILNAAIAIWCFGSFKVNTAPNAVEALFWDRFIYIGAAFTSSLFLHFVFELIEIRRTKILVSAYVSSVVVLILDWTPLFIQSEVVRPVVNYASVSGPLYPIFPLLIAFGAIYGNYELLRGYKRASGIKHNQIRYVFFAFVIALVGIIVYLSLILVLLS